MPGLLGHVGSRASLLTAVSDWARRKLEPAFGQRMHPAPVGDHTGAFHPAVSDAFVRERHALGDAPVVCVSRLVARKGQDMLIRALPPVRRPCRGCGSPVVGGGPYDAALRVLAQRTGVHDRVTFAGAVPVRRASVGTFRAGDCPRDALPFTLRRAHIEALGRGLPLRGRRWGARWWSATPAGPWRR
ncbi:MAG: glycosyltransferase [Gemmatimonadetes bacterium]|nr:glycosyltransferase [Gemmatimonadota bacterium]